VTFKSKSNVKVNVNLYSASSQAPLMRSNKFKGHSRSLETEPLDRSYTTYYKSSYLTLNIFVTLKCGLEVTEDH